jgi:TatD DNase family protein
MAYLIDTHCHLNDPDAFPEPGAAVEEAKEAGVEGLIVIGLDYESSARALEIAESHEGVYAAVGWHPNYAQQYGRGSVNKIEELLGSPKAVALGEVGLDYYRDHATPKQQERCLLEQLEMAGPEQPVVLHCRDAHEELLTLLEPMPHRNWVLHCFTGDADQAQRALAIGAYLGFDGPLTYPKADELRELLKSLPRDRVLLETDSPYMTPHPHRGKPNKPAYLPLICEALDRVWELDVDAVARITTANAERAFGRS